MRIMCDYFELLFVLNIACFNNIMNGSIDFITIINQIYFGDNKLHYLFVILDAFNTHFFFVQFEANEPELISMKMLLKIH